jgi:monomeric sarcosine oxidase
MSAQQPDRTMPTRVDFAVVGLGAAGASALSFLARAGAKVVGVDRFSPPHDQGSSHGETRLLRIAHSEGAAYVPLARRSVTLWRELEARQRADLFSHTGIVYCGPQDGAFMRATHASAQAAGVALINASERARACLSRLVVPASWSAVLDREAGYLEAEPAIAAFLADAEAHGAEIVRDCACLALAPDRSGVDIATQRGMMRADRAIVTAGAWARELVPDLASVTHIERRVLHWFADPGADFAEQGGFLPFALETEKGELFYGFPARGGELKVGEHFTTDLAPSPDALDRTIGPADTDHIKGLARRFLPGLGARTRSLVCMYPMSRDAHFILGPHPREERLMIGAGLCGHGFKFAPAIGEALANFALGREQTLDLSAFSPHRFAELR